MQTRTLGALGPVSVRTLGGGGLGPLWGEAFGGRLPGGGRLTPECWVGQTPPAEIEARIRGPRKPRRIMAKATAEGIGVMGIRAVQAGALTGAIDRPLPAAHAEVRDCNRAAAGPRTGRTCTAASPRRPGRCRRSWSRGPRLLSTASDRPVSRFPACGSRLG